MQSFKIKAWDCDGPSCKYTQDFEPNPEDNKKHHGNSVNVCPSCFKHPLSRSTDSRMEMNSLELSDKAIKEKEFRDNAPLKIKNGAEDRVETESEMESRVDTEVDRMKIKNPADKKSVKAKLMASGPITRRFVRYRDEFPEERAAWEAACMAKCHFKTPEEIQALRDKYEDK